MKEPLWLMTNSSRLSPCASIRKPYIPMGLQGHLHIYLSLLLKQRGRPFSLVYICGAISRNVCQGMQHELIQSVASSLQVKHFSQPCSDNWLTIGGSLSLATHIASTSPCLFRKGIHDGRGNFWEKRQSIHKEGRLASMSSFPRFTT